MFLLSPIKIFLDLHCFCFLVESKVPLTFNISEFLDDVQVDACNKFSGLDYPVQPALFLEFVGSENSVEEQALIAGTGEPARFRCCLVQSSVATFACYFRFTETKFQISKRQTTTIGSLVT